MIPAALQGPQPTVREIVALALAPLAQRFPHLSPSPPDLTGCSALDAALGLAIHRTVLQRWITLEFLLDRELDQPIATLQPLLRAILLSGAAQLLFMPRLPAYAVVDESAGLAGRLVRPKAAGIVNAVLRKLACLVGPVVSAPWGPAADCLPVDEGTLHLHQSCLPTPANLKRHLSIATSHPRPLLAWWLARFGTETATDIARHGVVTPPTIVAVEPGFPHDISSPQWLAHEQPGFIVWNSSHDHLKAFLAQNSARRVQDPASAAAAGIVVAAQVSRILDYCAGMGTKTRQLAGLFPHANIVATDVADHRRAALHLVAADLPHVNVVQPDAVGGLGPYDLLVLDVPCSNSAVLSRRPEARYRISTASLAELSQLQRDIASKVLPLAAPRALVLYMTCSLETQENQDQTQWLVAHTAGKLLQERQLLPAGRASTYHDGSYAALIQLP